MMEAATCGFFPVDPLQVHSAIPDDYASKRRGSDVVCIAAFIAAWHAYCATQCTPWCLPSAMLRSSAVDRLTIKERPWLAASWLSSAAFLEQAPSQAKREIQGDPLLPSDTCASSTGRVLDNAVCSSDQLGWGYFPPDLAMRCSLSRGRRRETRRRGKVACWSIPEDRAQPGAIFVCCFYYWPMENRLMNWPHVTHIHTHTHPNAISTVKEPFVYAYRET